MMFDVEQWELTRTLPHRCSGTSVPGDNETRPLIGAAIVGVCLSVPREYDRMATAILQRTGGDSGLVGRDEDQIHDMGIVSPGSNGEFGSARPGERGTFSGTCAPLMMKTLALATGATWNASWLTVHRSCVKLGHCIAYAVTPTRIQTHNGVDHGNGNYLPRLPDMIEIAHSI